MEVSAPGAFIAILHLGAVRFPITGSVRYSMTARDAVELCKLIRPRTAIPVHYEGWSHFSQGREGIDVDLREGTRRHPPKLPGVADRGQGRSSCVTPSHLLPAQMQSK